MGGATDIIRARTKTELREKVRKWTRGAKGQGLEDIRRGWDPKRVRKTQDGWYEIDVWAHS